MPGQVARRKNGLAGQNDRQPICARTAGGRKDNNRKLRKRPQGRNSAHALCACAMRHFSRDRESSVIGRDAPDKRPFARTAHLSCQMLFRLSAGHLTIRSTRAGCPGPAFVRKDGRGPCCFRQFEIWIAFVLADFRNPSRYLARPGKIYFSIKIDFYKRRSSSLRNKVGCFRPGGLSQPVTIPGQARQGARPGIGRDTREDAEPMLRDKVGCFRPGGLSQPVTIPGNSQAGCTAWNRP